MGIVFKNNAKTTLASNLTSSATSASVTDGSVFPSLSAGEFFLITFDDGTNNEICKCTARSGNTLTIVRAQESTTARAFSSGDAAEGRVTAGVLETIQENIAAKSANQTVYNTTTASSATDYDIGIDPSVEANAMVFLNGVMQHHDTFSFSGSTLTFDTAPPDGMALEVIVDNLINLQSSNLTVDTFTAADVGGNPQTDFVLSDTPAAETNLIVFVDGVFQDQDAYTISNQTLTITDGVTADFGVTVYVINPVNIGTPSDGTVTSAKLSGNITMPGTLTVGSNDVAFDSPTFVVDNANSRVGLGTASPSVPVDIVGDVKMSANLTVDTSTLVVDSTNNRVGIGTSSPDSLLHLSGGSAEKIIIEDSSNPRGNYIGIDGSDNLVIAADEDNLGSSSNIQFRVDASEKMKLDNTGRLLIGQDSGDAFNADAMLRLQRAGDRVFMQFKTDADQNSAILFGDVDDDVECAIEYEPVNQALTFSTGNNTEALRISSSGCVGVGSTVDRSLGTNIGTLVVNGSAGGGLWLSTGDSSATTSKIISSTSGSVGDLLINQGSGVNGGNIRFSINDSEKMRLDPRGNISFGGQTTNPNWSQFFNAISSNYGGHLSFQNNGYAVTALGNNYYINNSTLNERVLAQPTQVLKLDNLGNFLFESAASGTAGATFSFSEKIRISSEGNLLINTTSKTSFPTNKGAAAFGIGGEVNLKLSSYGTTHTYQQFILGGSVVGSISATTSSTSYNTSSDYRLKENVDYDFNALDRVAQLKPARFNFIADADKTVDGFLAHEVQDIVPEAITGEKDGVKEEEYEITPAVLNDDGTVVTEAVMGTREAPDYQGIDQSKLVPLLTKAIQEQQTQIETLKQEIREIREGG